MRATEGSIMEYLRCITELERQMSTLVQQSSVRAMELSDRLLAMSVRPSDACNAPASAPASSNEGRTHSVDTGLPTGLTTDWSLSYPVRLCWAWVSQALYCSHTHIKDAAEFHQASSSFSIFYIYNYPDRNLRISKANMKSAN